MGVEGGGGCELRGAYGTWYIFTMGGGEGAGMYARRGWEFFFGGGGLEGGYMLGRDFPNMGGEGEGRREGKGGNRSDSWTRFPILGEKGERKGATIAITRFTPHLLFTSHLTPRILALLGQTCISIARP